MLDPSKEPVVYDDQSPAKELTPKLIDDVLRQIMGYLPRGYGNLMFKYQPHERTLIFFYGDIGKGISYVDNNKRSIYDVSLSQREENRKQVQIQKKLC